MNHATADVGFDGAHGLLQCVRDLIVRESLIVSHLALELFRYTGAIGLLTQRLLAKRYTNNPEAYQAYLKGRYYWNKRTNEGFNRAIEFFTEAVQKDPAYALAYVGLADCYNMLGEYGMVLPRFERAATVWFERLLASRQPAAGIGGFANFGHEGVEIFLDTGWYRGAAGIGLALLAATTNVEPNWDRMMLLPSIRVGS
jgi:tetratricopeptide (TPR) repeat protein